MREEWQKITMLEACDLITCGVAARPKYVDEGVPFLSAKNVKEGKIIYEGYNCITEENHQELTKKNKPLVGDILYTRVGSYGEAAVIEEDIEFSVFVSLTLIKPKKELLNSYFLKYYLNSHEVKTLAKNSITSSGVGNLNVGTVRKFPVPIPPISEQKQIVALLDQAFTAIDQAKANIEKNIENAKELFDSKSEDYFNQLSVNNDLLPLNEVCEKIFAGGDKPKENFSKIPTEDLNIPIIANAVKDNGLYGYTNKAKVTKPSITIAARGSGTGHTEYRDYPFVPIVRLIVLTPNTDKIEVEFLMYSIKNLTISRSGSAIPQLTVPMIKSYSIPVPRKVKQKEIVESLNQLEIELEEYKSALERKNLDLQDLKKSILQKAFTGALTEKAVAV
jgi:type I restriction enzyme S subunit